MCKIDLLNNQSIIGFAYQGSTKVAEYAYDAWGNQKVMNGNSIEVTDLTHIAHVNPFRYREYYWDNHLGLYYLMSRYYDPQTGRFISAANTSTLNPYAINGLNLYSYASNNPINIAYNGSSVVSAVTMASTAVLQNATYSTENYRVFLEFSLQETLGIASNIFSILNGIDVINYLICTPGNTKSVGWLLKNYSRYGDIADDLGYITAVLDGITVMYETQDFWQGVHTVGYDIGSMHLSGYLGGLIGTAIGGIPGAIIGTIASLVFSAVFQHFKENIVTWTDDMLDTLWAFVLGPQSILVTT